MKLKYNGGLVVYLCMLFSMTFWSFSFIWYKEVYYYYSPITTVFLRLIISSVLLLTTAAFLKKLNIKRKDFKLFLLTAFFEPFLYFLCESFGMQMVSSVTAAVIISTVPVFTCVIAASFLNETLTRINIIGIIISFLGVGFVILKKGMQFDASPFGICLMSLAVAAAIGYEVVLKKLTVIYEPITIIAIQNTIGAFLFAPLFFLFDFHVLLTTGISLAGIILVLKLAILASSLAFILYAYGVNSIGLSKANIFINLITVFTAVFAYLILNEKLSIAKIIGIVFVVCGLFFSQVKKSFVQKMLSIIKWEKE
jgi:drug/metabolite transporter (DMT)-like permease